MVMGPQLFMTIPAICRTEEAIGTVRQRCKEHFFMHFRDRIEGLGHLKLSTVRPGGKKETIPNCTGLLGPVLQV